MVVPMVSLAVWRLLRMAQRRGGFAAFLGHAKSTASEGLLGSAHPLALGSLGAAGWYLLAYPSMSPAGFPRSPQARFKLTHTALCASNAGQFLQDFWRAASSIRYLLTHSPG
jgi:hypothetical protein